MNPVRETLEFASCQLRAEMGEEWWVTVEYNPVSRAFVGKAEGGRLRASGGVGSTKPKKRKQQSSHDTPSISFQKWS
jgi:hypothetical protein